MKPTTALETLAEQYAHWRAIKGNDRKTPPHLVKATVELIGKYPKNKILQVLGINNSTLKRWEKQLSPVAVENEFVEITDLGLPTPNNPLQLELQYSNLKLSVSGTCHELVTFVQQLSLGK